MKKCLFLVLMLVSVCAMGQEKHKMFCELLGHGKIFSTKVNVTVDFGQETSIWRKYMDHYLVDENGDKIKFNSMVDAMNYMGRLGWKFEQAYVVTTDMQNVYHWLLSKEVSSDEEIMEGFTTKKQYKEAEEQAEELEAEEEQQENGKKKKRRVITDDIYR